MHKLKLYRTKYIIVILCLFSLNIFLLNKVKSNEQVIVLELLNPKTKVALIYGKEILYKEITITKDEFLKYMRMNVPSTKEMNKSQIREKQRQLEYDRLLSVLRSRIIEKGMRDFSIEKLPSDLIATRTNETVNSFPEISIQQANDAVSRFKLFELWFNNHAAGEKVYLKKFSRKISQKEWSRLKHNITSKALKEFRKSTGGTAAGFIAQQKSLYLKYAKWLAQLQVKEELLVNKLRKTGRLKKNERLQKYLNAELKKVKFLHTDFLQIKSSRKKTLDKTQSISTQNVTSRTKAPKRLPVKNARH